MKDMLHEVIEALGYCHCSPEPHEYGYAAMVRLDVRGWPSDAREALCQYLTGKLVGDEFQSPVVDAHEQPVLFASTEEAMREAHERAQGLAKQFSYGVYASLGFALPVTQKATLFFKPRTKMLN